MRIEIIEDWGTNDLQDKINKKTIGNPNVIDIKFCVDGTKYTGIIIYKD